MQNKCPENNRIFAFAHEEFKQLINKVLSYSHKI